MKNKVNLIGRLGRDPEEHQFSDGDKVATINLATTEKWKDQNGNPQEATEWHTVKFYKKQAEIVLKYLKKGDLIDIEGKLKTRKSEKDGHQTYFTEIIGRNMIMLGKKKNENVPETQIEEGDDDLPF